MRQRYSVLLVDDDPVSLTLLSHCLEAGGFEVVAVDSGDGVVEHVLAHRPQCVMVDVMMPGLDGMEVCRRLRGYSELTDTRIIVMSSKVYDTDRRRALDLGADAFIAKPIEVNRIAGQVRRIIKDRVHLTFWGIRGTLPVSGLSSLRYGGNTPCVSMEFARGALLVFDAGTGIKVLSDHLRDTGRLRLNTHIFISHPHWDHINALPFFAPLYVQGSQIEILGPCQGEKCVEDFLRDQMDGVYFPITAEEFSARLSFRHLGEEILDLEDGIRVKTLYLHHPGHCLGYRVEYGSRILCYITDNEIYPAHTGLRDDAYVTKLTEFVSRADVLITDSTYTDEEYESHMHWGHSSVGEVVNLAHQAQVRMLYLFHHDPDQNDEDIDAKLEWAQARLRRLGSDTQCFGPVEGEKISL